MSETKINNNPTNYIQEFEKNKTEFDAYQERGEFNISSMLSLLNRIEDKRKWYFLTGPSREKCGYGFKIEFRYNTGTYRLILYAVFDIDLKYYWHKLDWIAEQLGMQKGTTYEKLKYTEFYFDYDDYTYLSLKDLFYTPKTKEDKKMYNAKKFAMVDSIFPWDRTIIKDARKLVKKMEELVYKVHEEVV